MRAVALLLTIPLLLANGFTIPINITSYTSNPLTFRLTLAAAVRMVHQQVPAAQLNRIECTSRNGPLLDPKGLTDVRLFFTNPSPVYPSLLLHSHPATTTWGQWAPLQYLHGRRPNTELALGDILTSDIQQVVATMSIAGQGGRFDAVDIVREEGMTEVWWQFQMSGRGTGWVWVGDESGRVIVEDQDGRLHQGKPI
ncbi:MAG: hypothetical protein Q9218_003928 [Villophora microphyllina]